MEILQANPTNISFLAQHLWESFESLKGSKCCILQANAGFQMQILAIVRCYDPTPYQLSW